MRVECLRVCSYLNMKGCEEEGLYRVPGAAHQIRYYEQKFDQGMLSRMSRFYLLTGNSARY
jgi:hypothetical protein